MKIYQNQSIAFFDSQKETLREGLKEIISLLGEDINEECGM